MERKPYSIFLESAAELLISIDGGLCPSFHYSEFLNSLHEKSQTSLGVRKVNDCSLPYLSWVNQVEGLSFWRARDVIWRGACFFGKP